MTNWFVDSPAHCNKIADISFAEHIFEFLHSNSLINHKKYKHTLSLLQRQKTIDYNFHDEKFINYIQELSKNRFDKNLGKEIGSIIINANPMTYGHKYLIDTALKTD